MLQATRTPPLQQPQAVALLQQNQKMILLEPAKEMWYCNLRYCRLELWSDQFRLDLLEYAWPCRFCKAFFGLELSHLLRRALQAILQPMLLPLGLRCRNGRSCFAAMPHPSLSSQHIVLPLPRCAVCSESAPKVRLQSQK